MFRVLPSLLVFLSIASNLHAQPLPGTKPLEMKGDLAMQMVEGIDRYLTHELTASVEKRTAYWKPDYSSLEAYEKSITPNRERLKKILGVVDQRLPAELEFVHSVQSQALVGEGKNFKAFAVRWSVLPGVFGEGLLLEPGDKPKACIVAIPDADQTPEMLVGLRPGLPVLSQYARLLAQNGNRVLIPTLVNREDSWSGSDKLKRFTNQTHREFVYRMSYQMGRHIIGYEVQKVLAAVDWFSQKQDHPPIGVYGYGEGGLLALYSAALDPRIASTVVSGHFGPRENLHDEPIYRNVWSLLKEFGDGEVMRLIAPRGLVIEHGPFSTGTPPAARAGRGGAAPGVATTTPFKEVIREIDRGIQALSRPGGLPRKHLPLVTGLPGKPGEQPAPISLGNPQALKGFLKDLGQQATDTDVAPPKALRLHDPENRQRRQFNQLVDYTQKLLPDSTPRRQEFFWNKLDTTSLDKLKKSQQPLRDYFWENIIGKLPEATMPINPRTRLHHETAKYKAYEVVLDVYDDVISYGILCVPNDLKPGEKRPVVVCQHGLEGRPTDVVNPKQKTPYYNSFGSTLAEQGFVVFAPQNPYIFKNEFRQTVRKANPLQLGLYSFIVRQHERILAWLSSLPFVDPARIAYYGLSYGGKVAMRIPAILEQYCLSICSGDFNEWIWKNINLEWQGSYMFTGEYEMYEFDLGNTFNYAEMAALIAPRPFMVERGHADGVGLDEYVAFEYAKVRRFYARLGIADRTEIEFFTGGHECRVVGTLAFLRKHLDWPAR